MVSLRIAQRNIGQQANKRNLPFMKNLLPEDQISLTGKATTSTSQGGTTTFGREALPTPIERPSFTPSLSGALTGVGAGRAAAPHVQQLVDPYAEERARRERERQEAERRIAEAQSGYRELAASELEAALRAINAQTQAGQQRIDTQLDQLPGQERRAIRGVQGARREAVQSSIANAISRGRVGGGAQQAASANALQAETEAKGQVETDFQAKTNELEAARQQLLNEAAIMKEQRKLANARRIQEFDLSALATRLGGR